MPRKNRSSLMLRERNLCGVIKIISSVSLKLLFRPQTRSPLPATPQIRALAGEM